MDKEPQANTPVIAEAVGHAVGVILWQRNSAIIISTLLSNFTCPKDALLYVPSHPARELDKDLKAAGIPKHTDDGKIAFHALRTCFVTLTYEAGANHKEAQQLARHSTPGLTANTYGRTRNERLAKVAETVADRVLFGQVGANTVLETESDVSAKVIK